MGRYVRTHACHPCTYTCNAHAKNIDGAMHRNADIQNVQNNDTRQDRAKVLNCLYSNLTSRCIDRGQKPKQE
jgi:hypothetical protein